jgi:hypothetical protein
LTHVAAHDLRVQRSENAVTRFVAELAIVALGVTCLVTAIGANQQWLDRHFLPSFLLPHSWFVLLETIVRIALAIAGAGLVTTVRRRAGRVVQREPVLVVAVAAAVVLAFGAGELALKYKKVQPAEWLFPDEEPLRRIDARLGWTFVPSRVGHMMIGGRDIPYAFDAHGYRVSSLNEPVDLERPSILFTGESVMVGEGLLWDETIAARVGSALDLQPANLAVHGYSSDQAYMRLEAELPRFRRPVAVVSLFMTGLFGRNLDRDRPYLTSGLVWQPPLPRSRLLSLAETFVPYRSDGTIEDGIRDTREVFRAAAALASARGATPLVVVPQFGHDDERDQLLRRRIFDGTGLAAVFVEIDPGWRIPWDRHPDARAARTIAGAITAALGDVRPDRTLSRRPAPLSSTTRPDVRPSSDDR